MRSARAARLPLVLPVEPEAAVPDEPVDEEPMVLPEPVLEPVLPLAEGVVALDEDDEPPEVAEPPEPLVLPEPALGEAPIVDELPELVAAPPPAGVPVVPIGVFWVLRWPAPVAASLFGVAVGGVLWATAVPTTATAARPASRDLRYMRILLFDWVDKSPAKLPAIPSVGGWCACYVSSPRLILSDDTLPRPFCA